MYTPLKSVFEIALSLFGVITHAMVCHFFDTAVDLLLDFSDVLQVRMEAGGDLML